MEFTIGRTILRFNKDFKPKSLTLFLKVYGKYGEKDELTVIYDKLNGNNTRADKKPRKTRRKNSTK